MIYGVRYTSPLGHIRILSDGKAITELYTEFWNGRTPLSVDFSDGSSLPCIIQTIQWLDIYFSGKKPDFTPPLNPSGSAFRREVWDILLTIPYGELITYGDIASTLAQRRGKAKMSAQAVGGAVGANPIGIIIPCHRVIGANGNLTGYAGGLKSKINLLKLEGIDTAKLTLPQNSRFL